jgi:hypothetical protein
MPARQSPGVRRIRWWTGVLAVTAGLATLNTAGTTAQDRETEQVNRVIPFSPGGTLKLKNFSGKVRITGGDIREVTVDAVRRAPRERLDRIALDIQHADRTITIEANRQLGGRRRNNNVVETDFDIKVPRDTRLDVSVFSSDVTVDGVTAAQDVQGFSSTLDLRQIAADLKAKTFSGPIQIEVAGGGPTPSLDLDTFSGDIDVRLPASAAGRVQFSSFSGDLTSDHPLTLVSKTGRRKLTARLNTVEAGGSQMTFHTFSGDVTIRK